MTGNIDFEVFAVEPGRKEGDKSRWTRIGVAFTNAESISVKLSAYPVRPELVLLKPKPKEEQKEKLKMNVFGG